MWVISPCVFSLKFILFTSYLNYNRTKYGDGDMVNCTSLRTIFGKKKSINVLVLRFSGFLPESFCRYLIRLIRLSSFEHHPRINNYIWRINDWNFDFCLKALPLGLNSCKALIPLEATGSLDPPTSLALLADSTRS